MNRHQTTQDGDYDEDDYYAYVNYHAIDNRFYDYDDYYDDNGDDDYGN